MNDRDQKHALNPAFRDALERSLIAEYHADAPRAVPRARPTMRWRTALAMAAGLLLGVGVQFAAGQVQDSRQRNDIVASLQTQRALASVKLELANAQALLSRKKFDAGVISKTALLSAEADVIDAEAAVKVIDLNLEETQITFAEPRDELWAPLVKGRDFVKERLRANAGAAAERLKAASVALGEVESANRLGSASTTRLLEIQLDVADLRGGIDAMAAKEVLRKETLEKNLKPAEVTYKLQIIDLTRELQSAERRVLLARQRVVLLQTKVALGTVEPLDAKRAELESMQQAVLVAKLRHQLELLKR